MYLVRTPTVVQRLFPDYTWRGRAGGERPRLYLTFDDGPIPGVTPWVLETLAAYDARATFFCVGENAERYPGLLRDLEAAGHTLGNHTHNHLSGWGTERTPYVANVSRCAEAVDSPLFRPPYGRLRPSQAEDLRSRDYRIVMWDVLSGDFDADLSPADCLSNVIDNAVPGSIVVFHDSLKAERNLRHALPGVLAHYAGLGFEFAAL